MTRARPVPTVPDVIASELERLRPLGGLVELEGFGSPTPKLLYPLRCGPGREAFLAAIAPYRKKDTGEDWALRHWPWVALACDRWEIANKAFARFGAMGLTPTDISGRIERIAKAADKIDQVLSELMDAGAQANDHERTKAGHLQWLLGCMVLAQEGRVSLADYRQDPEAFAVEVEAAALGLLAQMKRLSAAADVARGEVRADLLRADSVRDDPGLVTFVGQLAVVWRSLTGRSPSVNKLSSRPSDDRPDFVKFVQAVADVQIKWSAKGSDLGDEQRSPFNLIAPTDDMIQSAFRHTPHGAEK